MLAAANTTGCGIDVSLVGLGADDRVGAGLGLGPRAVAKATGQDGISRERQRSPIAEVSALEFAAWQRPFARIGGSILGAALLPTDTKH